VDFTAIHTVDDEGITKMSDGHMKSPFAHMRDMSSQTGVALAPNVSLHVQSQFSQVSSRAIDRANNSQTEVADLNSGFQVAVGVIDVMEAMGVAQTANIEFQIMDCATEKSSGACEGIMNIQRWTESMSGTLGVTAG
jgi:flagellar hook-basal body complex protein FliE